jgi:enoyl-CoA hydratase/carnithine racemase
MPNAFHVDELDGKIALVTFDVPEKKVNTLSQDVLRELAGLFGNLEQRTDLRGLLLRSGKQGQFIAGADLNDLAALSFISKEQAAGALGAGHALFGRISRLPFPTVALIDGNCLGGGTELALSMDDRLVVAAPHTQVGLPEVKIGLIPGWGGTQRLPRLIGLNPAIEIITTGEHFSAAKAVALVLEIDAVPS